MTDSKIQSVLFELQKNLEDLSSAKIQMEEFRSSSKNVVQGIGHVQQKFAKHIIDLETDYKQRVSKLEEVLFSFLLLDNPEHTDPLNRFLFICNKVKVT